MMRLALFATAVSALAVGPAIAATTPQDRVAGMLRRVKVADDPLDPEVELSTPHHLKGAEAWLRGYIDKKTGALMVQLLAHNNATRPEFGPVAINFLVSGEPVQRDAAAMSAPAGRCAPDATCLWAPGAAPVPSLCPTTTCMVGRMLSVPWIVTTLPADDVSKAAAAGEPWRFKLKSNYGDTPGEIPPEYFGALLSVAAQHGYRPPSPTP